MLPDNDSLALFVRAAEFGSITKASEAQHIGLAAASRRISLLEHHFKTPLFERTSKGVELTSAGKAALVHAKTLLSNINRLQADIADHVHGRKGVVHIMANTSAMIEFLPLELTKFYDKYSDIRLVIQERWSNEIIRAVLAAEVDLGIVVGKHDFEGVEYYDYRTDNLVVVTPQDHALVKHQSVNLADLLEYDLVGLESGAAITQLIKEKAAETQKALQMRIEVRSFDALARMVQAGMGVGILPYYVAVELSRSLALSMIDLDEPWSKRLMYVCVRSSNMSNTLVKRVLEHLISSSKRSTVNE